jgi:hypothetical protein
LILEAIQATSSDHKSWDRVKARFNRRRWLEILLGLVYERPIDQKCVYRLCASELRFVITTIVWLISDWIITVD